MGDLLRPPPRRSPIEHAVAVARWIGIGRIVAVGITVLAVAAGAVWLLGSPESAEPGRAAATADVSPPSLPAGSALADAACGPDGTDPGCAPAPGAPSTTTTTVTPVVHVAGAVVVPGVYQLGVGARIGDAVAAAGGAAPDAALDAVNLAAPVADGQQVYVPHAGEASGPAPVPAEPGPSTAPGPLDLNTATEQQLLDLPGVGPVLAAAIVRHREQVGAFTSVEGLLDVSGIGPARLESLRDLVRV